MFLVLYISSRCLNCVQSAVVLAQNIIPTRGILEDLGLLVYGAGYAFYARSMGD